MSPTSVRTMAGVLFCLLAALPTLMPAQTVDDGSCESLRHPGWSYGVQISGGSTVVQVSSPSFVTANRNISNLALSFHLGRVLTHEHGRGWSRGTFEWDFNVVPIETFWVLGYHYAGGFEAFGPRWNFTHNRRRLAPFAGLAGGMLFSPQNFPPGPTYQTNFTVAFDAGAHLFLHRKRSLDVVGRVYHLSNAFLGHSNPGIPIGLQLTIGYLWY
jgi:Lipid A 3-O-deacylase (PagL)